MSAVIIDSDPQFYSRIQAGLKRFKELEISVGPLGGGKEAMIATVHEYGAVIRPKKGQYLTIPMIREARGKSATSFKFLKFFKSKAGNAFLADLTGPTPRIYYQLVKEVRIPERSFLRRTADSPKTLDKLKDEIERNIDLLLSPEKAVLLARRLGVVLENEVKATIQGGIAPPLQTMTIALKGSGKQLVDTGRLLQSIVSEVR